MPRVKLSLKSVPSKSSSYHMKKKKNRDRTAQTSCFLFDLQICLGYSTTCSSIAEKKISLQNHSTSLILSYGIAQQKSVLPHFKSKNYNN